VVAAVHAAIAVAAHAADSVVAAALAADSAAAVVAPTVVEAAATAVADTGKFRLIARNEKPALLRQAGFLHARRSLCSSPRVPHL
jgi:hypothetical protein